MAETNLFSPIEYLKGVGPTRGEILKKELKIHTYSDLLHFFPFRYIDKTKIYTISEINADLPFIQLTGSVVSVELLGEKRATRLLANFSDGTGTIELVWFKSIPYMQKIIKPGIKFLVFGKPTEFNHKYSIVHPEMDLLSEAKPEINQSLVPVYSSTEKLKLFQLDSKGLMRLQLNLHEALSFRNQEFLPVSIIEKYKLSDRNFAYQNIHFPTDAITLKQAETRIKFEEFLLLQLRLLKNKNLRMAKSEGQLFSKVGNRFNDFYHKQLPFELTEAQKKVFREIRLDTNTGRQMNRLLQGDVGSGKTVVALMTMLLAIDNGFQACMMAPTEILANQHLHSLTQLLKDEVGEIALLTGNIKGKKRATLLNNLKEGKIKILVGTHALIEEPVVFQNLGLAVIDEQHRFGVEQRSKLWKKNILPPHILVMTATPIPRTLAMTLYGDLDVSVIDQMPAGRKAIQTIHRYDTNRLAIFGFLRKEIALGRQIYIVYPLIEESANMDYKDLMDGFESLSRDFPQPEYQISIVHGRMKSSDKEIEMQRFIQKKTQIMVATTVIEVGVNVPNASVMIIESAERFGLSQLHQLRGRVGRGSDQSYCVLMTSQKLSPDAKTRIETMVRTNDGFEISETDLRLRGPGEIQGTQQSGVLGLKLADLVKDQLLLQEARATAIELLSKDPFLSEPKHSLLLHELQLDKQNKEWARIS